MAVRKKITLAIVDNKKPTISGTYYLMKCNTKLHTENTALEL